MMRQEGKKDKATKRRVNVSKKSVMALSTNSALRAAADVGDKCQLHLITPTLITPIPNCAFVPCALCNVHLIVIMM